jgi:hypothetical protein
MLFAVLNEEQISFHETPGDIQSFFSGDKQKECGIVDLFLFHSILRKIHKHQLL